METSAEIVQEAVHTAEDGLDPTDALTAREALARIVWLLRTGEPVSEGYQVDVGILDLLQWSHSEPRSLASNAYRRHLEEVNLLAVVGHRIATD